MKIILPVLVLTVFLTGCDESRVYEKNYDIENRTWRINDKPEFEFDITENQGSYNLYCDIRNAVAFPYSRLFFNYYLVDSAGVTLKKELKEVMLFDPKTGKPFGQSGLGDIYDHRIQILKGYHFPYNGAFKVRFEQYMRTDTLQGILAVGLRIEKNAEEQ